MNFTTMKCTVCGLKFSLDSYRLQRLLLLLLVRLSAPRELRSGSLTHTAHTTTDIGGDCHSNTPIDSNALVDELLVSRDGDSKFKRSLSRRPSVAREGGCKVPGRRQRVPPKGKVKEEEKEKGALI